MANYEQIIAGIHSDKTNGHIVDEHDCITIDPKTRELNLPTDFNSTIAYAGDINSQIVRFVCPITYDGHSLKDCSNHEIRWYNSGSGIGDTSKLEVGDIVEGGFILSWLAPPEAVTKNGAISIVITIYDKVNDEIKYQWNTAPFRSLFIGETIEDVDVKAPSKDKILILNPKTRSFILPAGYNTTIATQGDIGTAEVYFQSPRYINNIDLLDANNVVVTIAYAETDIVEQCSIYRMDGQLSQDKAVLITWKPSYALTKAGEIQFYLVVTQFDNKVEYIEKQWCSKINSSLLVDSMTAILNEEIERPDGLMEKFVTITWPLDKQSFYQMLEKEFEYVIGGLE